MALTEETNIIPGDDKKRIEELEEKLKKAEWKISNQDTLINIMNQNIRGPLYSIMEMARLAQEDPTGIPELESYLEKVSLSGSHMRESMDDVIALRRLAMHEVSTQIESIFLRDFFNKQSRDVARNLVTQKLVFSMARGDLARQYVMADYNFFSLTVRKLVKSAAYYADKGSKIRLSVSKADAPEGNIGIKLDCEFAARQLPEDAFHVMRLPVEQLNMHLGLDVNTADLNELLLKALSAAQDSREILINTEDKRHCKLQIVLVYPLATVDKPKRRFGKNILKGKRVLVCDDDEINLEIIEKILKDKGMIVSKVSSGHEALRSYRSEHGVFDAIIMDIVLPDISGFDVAKEIRAASAIETSSTVPIIAMTANAFNESYEESVDARMDAYLVKPVDPDRLYYALEKYL